MDAARIQTRAVIKFVAIALAAIGAALLLEHIVLEIRTTIRWVAAAIFLALALSPLVDLVERLRIRGRGLPRWLAILVAYVLFGIALGFAILHVIPPIVREVAQLGPQLPAYIHDFEQWAERNDQFRELNDRYDITRLLSEEARQLPSHLGDAANTVKAITVSLLNNVVAAIIVLTLAYFLLLDGARQFERATTRIPGPARDRVRSVAARIAAIVRSYVSVNLLFAVLAGLFTWLALELLGVDLAVPLAVLVGFLDLVPLIGFTVGGLLVAVVAALHEFPTALLIWVVLFIVYQQVQDRVLQPLLYRSAVRLHPAVAIIAVLAGAQLAGILGALLAIPVAAALGAIFDELWPRPAQDDPEPAPPGTSGAGDPDTGSAGGGAVGGPPGDEPSPPSAGGAVATP